MQDWFRINDGDTREQVKAKVEKLFERVEALEKKMAKYNSFRLNSFECNKCEVTFTSRANVLYLHDVYEFPKNEWKLCNDCLVNFIHWVGQDPKI